MAVMIPDPETMKKSDREFMMIMIGISMLLFVFGLTIGLGIGR